jgi:hypothetical protein
MNNIDLTELEQALLDKSANLDVTRSRRRMSIVVPLILILAVVLVPTIRQSPQLLLSLFVAYVVIVALERIAYANAVLGYKSLIQKLTSHIEALEKNGF